MSFVVVVASLVACRPGGTVTVSRQQVEAAHGVKLPPSARNFQQVASGGSTDRGVLTLFELNADHLSELVRELKVRSTEGPAITGPGDPCINGWNVWPKTAKTFVPGNRAFDRLRKTWSGEPVPIKMLSCDSPKGDWLHVELWSVGDHMLVKLYTDWN